MWLIRKRPVLKYMAAAVLVGMFPFVADAAEQKSIGFALTGFHIAMHPTAGIKEICPEGLNYSSLDQFNAQFPTEAARQQQYLKSGFIDNRGPNGENVTYVPWVVRDPLPWREVAHKIGIGDNLDGTPDGRETGTTCKHEKFVSPDGGARDVDNQLYRVMGCVQGFRKSGFPEDFFNGELLSTPNNRFLIEITGVDDEVNDDSVEVNFYKGVDKIAADAEGIPFPWLTHRVDARAPEYHQKTAGKIVDGKLITAPMPKLVRLFMHADYSLGDYEMRDARLHLNLGATHAQGTLTGYSDVEKWYFLHAKLAGRTQELGKWSGPALWQALLKNADGHKDPVTGRCTSISSTYQVEAVRAYIVKVSNQDTGDE